MGNRNTVRRNFSITKRADMALEEMSDEWDMSRSEIVTKAVLEYTDRDRTARIEEKLDDVLDRLDEPRSDGGTLSENNSRKEKRKSRADVHTFDPSDYDPDGGDVLTKDELKQLLKEVNDPVINPDHVDTEMLQSIRNNYPQDAALAAIIRYENEKVSPNLIEDYVRDYLGSSDYILNTHPEGVADHFYPDKMLVSKDSAPGFEMVSNVYYTKESERINGMEEILSLIQEAADQPFNTLPDGFSFTWKASYMKMRRWLAVFQQDIIDAGLLSRPETTSLIEEMGRQQDEVNRILAELEDEFKEGALSTAEFTTEEAAESLSWDTDEVEGLMTILENRGLAEETSDGFKITR